MRYEHTQARPELALALLAAATLTAIIALAADQPALWVTTAILLAVALVGYGLSSLTVIVDTEQVSVRFRWGRPRRSIPLERIRQATRVRNAWWHGWGIRWLPGATMFNVWGRDAVHLELDAGRDFRIGTDDPDGLTAAIVGATTAR